MPLPTGSFGRRAILSMAFELYHEEAGSGGEGEFWDSHSARRDSGGSITHGASPIDLIIGLTSEHLHTTHTTLYYNFD